jgi:predicted Zn-dependent protease
VKNTSKHATQLTRAVREPISASQEAFLERLDGMVVGQRAANGIVKENTFRHPDLNLFIQFPDGWHVENTPTKVASAPKDGRRAVVFQAAAEGDDPLDGVRAMEKANKTKLETKTHPIKVNGLPAATTRFTESNLTVDMTWIAHGGTVYLIAAFAPTREFQDVEPVFRQVAQSFRPLSAKERAAISEDRIRLVKARQGENVRAIAARSHTVWSPEQIAVANNLTDYEPLPKGHIIKIVVSEPYEGKKR